MYQAWVVQKFGEKQCNVILGRDFKTVEEACEAIDTYKLYFGKCDREVVEEAGKEIPTQKPKRESLLKTIIQLFN